MTLEDMLKNTVKFTQTGITNSLGYDIVAWSDIHSKVKNAVINEFLINAYLHVNLKTLPNRWGMSVNENSHYITGIIAYKFLIEKVQPSNKTYIDVLRVLKE